MTKHRKQNQDIKDLKKKREIPLYGSYLREKQLIDNLSCKIQEKSLIQNIMPANSDIPYPKIQVKNKNKEYARILSNDFCGSISEFSSVSQYSNHEIRLTGKYDKAAKTILSISKTEMMHMHMIGKLITLLGGDLNYSYYDNSSYVDWSPRFVNFGTNYVNMILLDINDEYKAIKQYENHIKIIDDDCIKAVLSRIIKDEKYHIELLTGILDENNYSSKKD
ncbi:ferritin family protein [uncultured Clostridium sp.]|uniref:ferritin-like domain-containing protein n=1 Tax=uncultured Clostridium sp. TaxID=59620 RepID=UPI0025E47676|nr:ferritin family protein [uncultured Clostridium sp.]